MKEALKAINKFYYFSMNYPSNFIKQVWADDPSLASHFEGKFELYYDRYGSYGAINAFFGSLSQNNQIKLMTWVMENFNNEQSLNLD